MRSVHCYAVTRGCCCCFFLLLLLLAVSVIVVVVIVAAAVVVIMIIIIIVVVVVVVVVVVFFSLHSNCRPSRHTCKLRTCLFAFSVCFDCPALFHPWSQ